MESDSDGLPLSCCYQDDTYCTYIFYQAPTTFDEMNGWLRVMRPFQSRIVCVVVDDQGISKYSMGLIFEIARIYDLPEPTEVTKFK